MQYVHKSEHKKIVFEFHVKKHTQNGTVLSLIFNTVAWKKNVKKL